MIGQSESMWPNRNTCARENKQLARDNNQDVNSQGSREKHKNAHGGETTKPGGETINGLDGTREDATGANRPAPRARSAWVEAPSTPPAGKDTAEINEGSARMGSD